MRSTYSFIAIATLTLFAGCDAGPKSSMGFTLPDGDAAQGKAEFVAFRCYDCHKIAGLELPEREESEQTIVALGGEVSRIKTYGELVTSVINPSHRLAKGFDPEEVAEDGESKMTNYNDVLTVSQLIDLVAFLQSHYKLREYERTLYTRHGY
jgi:sulfur-oxidizing protein SoxX